MQYLYLMRTGNDHYKIGIAADADRRVLELQTGGSSRIELITARLMEDAALREQELHRQYAAFRTSGGSEWFELSPSVALQVCAEINAPVKVVSSQRPDEALAEKAYRIFQDEGRASTSLLQRKLQIGYGRASRILDLLESQGRVSQFDGARPRSVY